MQGGNNASSDAVSTQKDCIFCQKHGIARNILKETASFRLVADHAPLVPGHLLIIPKDHYTCYGDVPSALDEELYTLKREVQQFLTRFYAPIVFWEHGIFRQTVFHAHLHCFPFGAIEFDPSEGLHEIVVTSQDDIRAWHAQHGQYFYLEDRQRALLFTPQVERYLHVVQQVLWPGAVSRNGTTKWRSPQQRQEEGEPLIQAVIAHWRAFQQQGVNDDANQSCTR
ncbi:MAG TPA: HIT family protein [Ktedonosporobacter sp.]|nr:HIT family protein [Ktedonosporobacter sp.]